MMVEDISPIYSNGKNHVPEESKGDAVDPENDKNIFQRCNER